MLNRSKNNIFLEVSKGWYKRYTKTVPAAVSGFRFNPVDNNRRIQFILVSSVKDFNYRNDVIEIYTEEEDRFFVSANPSLFDKGFLKEYRPEEYDEPEDSICSYTNYLSDEEVEIISDIKSFSEFQKYVSAIDSPAAFIRIFNACVAKSSSNRIIQFLEEKLLNAGIEQSQIEYMRKEARNEQEEEESTDLGTVTSSNNSPKRKRTTTKKDTKTESSN